MTETTDKKTPKALRPMIDHGADLAPQSGGDDDWCCDCPFCGKRKHFFANPERGTWDCKVCGASGNATTYLTMIHAMHAAVTTTAQLRTLSADRGLPVSVLRDAGLAWDGDRWLIPCRSETGTCRDLLKYDGRKLMVTAGCETQLWGADRLAAAGEGADVFVCEGAWDGMAMRWMLKTVGSDAVVVATPGATIFREPWISSFSGKRVVTVYDNDDAGDRGQIKSESALRPVVHDLEHVCWPETLPDGWDLRDFVRARSDDMKKGLRELESLKRSAPRREVGDGSSDHPGEKASTKVDERKIPESSLKQVLEAFNRHLDMSDEAVDAVLVMLAVCLSNDIKDDPVWVYLMGPAGAGKTELLTALYASSRCVFRSTVTPKCLVSGFRGEGTKDPSLIPRLKGKTFVAKDFTEILSMPEVAQKEIYSTLRGAFDGFVDKTFGNGAERRYHDCHFTMIAGATPAILKHRESAMGERFLKLRLSRPPREAARSRATRSLANLGLKKSRSEELQKVVAGYLKKRLPKELPPFPVEAEERIVNAAELVATMRAQVERDQRRDEPQYKPEPEGLDRVTKQLGALAAVLSWMHGEDEVRGDALRIIEKVAIDTVCGFDSDVVEAIMGVGGAATRKDIAVLCGIPTSTVARRIEDLVMTKVLTIEEGTPDKSGGGRPPATYVVREDVASLWRRVHSQDKSERSDKWSSSKQLTSSSQQPQSESGKSSSSRKRQGATTRGGSTRFILRRKVKAQ